MNLAAWLDHIQTLHPREIELGLDRVRQVAERLGLDFSAMQVVTVAGTNGKGSCVALTESILQAHGLRVGAYSSPHVHRFNERIRIDTAEAGDADLCQAFELIESARDDIPLTYFEFGTLAALLLFKQAALDVLVLEVGLGGRLDAVNIIDPQVAVITSIDLDHQAWLGNDREAIGAEKAGILRPGRPLVLVEPDPPTSIIRRAAELEAPVYRLHDDFGHTAAGDGWHWWGCDQDRVRMDLGPLATPVLLADLAAAAMQAVLLLRHPFDLQALNRALATTRLPGRFELILDRDRNRRVLFDVAHNPAAGHLLTKRLMQFRATVPGLSRVSAVLAMMADKDVMGFVSALDSAVDIWYIAQVNQARCMPADRLARQLESVIDPAKIVVIRDARSAYESACAHTGPNDIVLVTGSFFTVAELRGWLTAEDGR